jgi:hypothetical protein
MAAAICAGGWRAACGRTSVGLEVANTPHAGPDDIPSPVRTAAGRIRMPCPAGCATRSKHSLFRTWSWGCESSRSSRRRRHPWTPPTWVWVERRAATAATTPSRPQLGQMPQIPWVDVERAGGWGIGAGRKCIPLPPTSDPQPLTGLSANQVAPTGGCPSELQRPEGIQRAGAA